MASIIVMSGIENKYYPLGGRTYVIGRSEKLEIQVVDEYVSRKHLQLRFDEGANCYYALDAGSRHGVFVNGVKIGKETGLSDEDRIRIGDTIIFFTNEDFADSESALSHLKKTGELKYPTEVE
jgi:pSer/pThr/pTyr-binding forkhead associated (FHA) protein